jgi:hypothetical protein
VNTGAGANFGPVKKAIKHLLVFFAQTLPKWFPPIAFGFQNMTIRQKCAAHFPSQGVWGQSSGWCPPNSFEA